MVTFFMTKALIHHFINTRKIQYNACKAITGPIRGISKEKKYHELGLESLDSRLWFRKLCSFFKVLKNKLPDYLFRIIPQRRYYY